MRKTILIGGDIVPTSSNRHYFENGTMEKIVSNDLLQVLKEADYRIFNLETPIADKRTPIEKEGPCFITSTQSVNGLKQLNVDLVTLANNHILDQGVEGLNSTINALSDCGITYTGVGKNSTDAKNAKFFELDGLKVGVYGCVEHEYTLATESRPGANAFEPLDISDEIRRIKEKCDYLIVLYHGGKEYYRYPSPELQKRCRKMAECGADFILCQHSHCIGAIEEYSNCKILYGQGNFILDSCTKGHAVFFQTSLLVQIHIEDNACDWTMIPLIKNREGVRLANAEEAQKILGELEDRSKDILQDDFVKDNYKTYADIEATRYIVRLSRFGYIISAIDHRFFKGKLLKFNIKRIMGKHQRRALQNCLQCEVHNEVLRTYLETDE